MMAARKVLRSVLGYGVGACLGATAIGTRLALDPWLGEHQSLSLLFGAVALTVWLSGIGPAIAVAALGYVASDLLFIPPRGVLAVINATEAVALATYIVSCLAIIGFGHGMRVARRRAMRYASHLAETTKQLELAHRHKDEFLATLAHELRNPLAPIRTALALMIAREPELTMAKNTIDRQSRHLMRLVEDLSDLSRVRAGKINLQKAVVPIETILSDAIEIARPRLEAARHALELRLPDEPLYVNGDATRLTQAFANLLNNAARYTPDGGNVIVEMRRVGSSVEISVTDNGIGIRADMLPKIFDLYHQGNAPSERSAAGLGIGLTLASRLVWLHEGTLEADSAGEGKGSRFTTRLPLATPVREGSEAVEAVVEVGSRFGFTNARSVSG